MDDNSLSNSRPDEEKLPAPHLPNPTGLAVTPPRPTVTNAPPPSPTGFTLPQPQNEPVQPPPPSSPDDDEQVFDVQNLGDDEANDLYQKARNYFYVSFGSMIPVIGILIACFCWLKTKGWKNRENGWEVDDVSEMISIARKTSKVWFVFSCVNAFVCLTSIEFPYSLMTMSFFPLLVGVSVLPLVFLIPFLAYHLLDVELDRYRGFLVSIQAMAGSIAYMEVSHIMFQGALNFTALIMMLGFMSFSLYSVLGAYHRTLPPFKVGLVALISWATLSGAYQLFLFLW